MRKTTRSELLVPFHCHPSYTKNETLKKRNLIIEWNTFPGGSKQKTEFILTQYANKHLHKQPDGIYLLDKFLNY